MAEVMTAKAETTRMMFEYVQEEFKRYVTARNPTEIDVISSYEILMYQVCSYSMTDKLEGLLTNLDNITLYNVYNEMETDNYRSCLLYDCLAVALEKNHQKEVQILLKCATQNQRESTSTTSLASKGPYSLLHCAAANGNVDIITLLISSGCDVNQINANGETALHFASDANIAQILLDHGADVNGMQIRHTPLYYACASSNLGVITKLLDWGASTNLGLAKLNEACKSRVDSRIAEIIPVFRSNALRLNISGGCFLGFCRFLGKAQPLCSTCKQENQLLVEKLRKNANLTICQNSPPLIRAIWDLYEKKTETGTEDTGKIQLILSESELSIVNVIDESGTTPLYVAVERNLIEVAKLLLACGAKPNLTNSGKYPLFVACKYLSYEFVRILLTGGADPNVVDFQGESPLCLAASSFDHRLVKLLVEHGADVNLKDLAGRRAFHAVMEQLSRQRASDRQSPHSCLSATAECVKVAIYLIDNGSNINHTTSEYGNTALNMLAEFAFYPQSTRRFFRRSLCLQLFDLLLERGADIRKCLRYQSPMFLATSLKSLYGVRELLRHGGNANDICNGFSVLHEACCWTSSTLIVRTLLAAGADLNSINWKKCYLMMQNTELIDLLLNYGAIINIPKEVVARPPRLTCSMTMAAKQNAELTDLFVTNCREAEGLIRLFKAGCSLEFLAACCGGEFKQITNTSCAQLGARLCQAIALFENNVQHQQLVTLLKHSGRPKDYDLASWFDENSMTLPSLSCLSRIAARRQLSAASGGRTILPLIDVLEIPIQLRMYLRFEGPWSEVDITVSDDVSNNDTCSCNLQEDW